MDISTVAITALGAIALLIAVALPAWIAWIVAWRSKMDHSVRRSFLFVCLLLSYGVLTLTGAILLPLEIAAVYIAPALDADGYEQSGKAIWVASQWVPAACLVAGFIAAFMFPMYLRNKWQAIVLALSANSSFKPTPLRGAA
jgi:hypothetical protein